MQGYTYDEDGYFINIIDLEIDPLESREQGQDVFLVPRNAVLNPPDSYDPSAQEARWNGSAWDIVSKREPEREKWWLMESATGRAKFFGFKPGNEVIAEIPDALKDEDIEWLDVFDGRAVVNDTKKSEKLAEKAAKEAEEQATIDEALARRAEIVALKADLPTMTLPEVKVLLEKVIEELGL